MSDSINISASPNMDQCSKNEAKNISYDDLNTHTQQQNLFQMRSNPSQKKLQLINQHRESTIKLQQDFDSDENFSNSNQNKTKNSVAVKKIAQNLNFILRIKKKMMGILDRTQSRMFQKLNKLHYHIIGDNCFFYSENKEVDRKYNYLTRNQYSPKVYGKFAWQQIPIFQPNSTFIISWHLFLFVTLLLNLVEFPVLIAFNYDTSSELSFDLFFIWSFIIILLEILVNLNKGFYNEGSIIQNRKEILLNYFKSYMILDIITLFFLQFRNKYFQCIFILRIKQILKLYSEFEDHFQLQQKFFTFNELFKLLFLVVIIAHFCACGFYLVGSQPNKFGTWLQNNNLVNVRLRDQYISSLYFAFITMVTVGYGDIHPVNTNEKIYSIFMTLIACCIFAYTVSAIGSIFQEKKKQQADFKMKKQVISKYMDDRNINKQTEMKVLRYLEYISGKNQEKQFMQRGEQIIQQLSNNLQQEIQLDFFGKILNKIQLFSSNFSAQFLKSLSLNLSEKSFGPGEVVANNVSESTKSIFYIYKGELEIFLDQNNGEKQLIMGRIAQGSLYGEEQFFLNTSQQLTVRSVGITNLVIIQMDKFQDTIKQYPDMLQQKIDSQYRYSKCISCGSCEHQSLQCPLIQYKPIRAMLFARYNYSLPQNRKQQVRKNECKVNTYHLLSLLRQQLRALRYDLAQQAVPEDNEEKQKEVQELFEYDYTKHGDQQFILNTPGVKIIDNKLELMEDDPLFDEDDYFQFLSEIEYEKKNTAGTNGTRNSEGLVIQQQAQQVLKLVSEQEKESSDQKSTSQLSVDMSQDKDKSSQQIKIVFQKDSITDKDMNSQENTSEIESNLENRDNTDKSPSCPVDSSLKVDTKTRSQPSSSKIQSSEGISLTSNSNQLISSNLFPRYKTPELSNTSAKSLATLKSNLSNQSSTQKKHRQSSYATDMSGSEQSIPAKSSQQQLMSNFLREKMSRSGSNYSATSISKNLQRNDSEDDSQAVAKALSITSSLRLLQRNIEKRITKKESIKLNRQMSSKNSQSQQYEDEMNQIQQFGTEYEELKNDFFIIKDFDVLKVYKNYFPEYNVNTVLQEIKKKQLLLRQERFKNKAYNTGKIKSIFTTDRKGATNRLSIQIKF